MNAIGRLPFAQRGHFSIGDGALVHPDAAVRVNPFDSGLAALSIRLATLFALGTEKKMKIPLSTYWNFLAALLVSYMAADNHSLQRADRAKYAISL